ncbi:MAG: PD40 domain-containing protein [Deltaproteobacteria bacterium]|nr:PD40 domain-containing protein [Deltaproteobacteria bacterium]
MLQIHRSVPVIGRLVVAAAAVVALGATAPIAHAEDVIIDVSGTKKGAYPIALPTAVEGDAAIAKEVASVQAFDLSVAGPFKVLDPQGFLADLKTEGLSLDPQKWKDVGAYGVVKFRATATEIEFRLYEVSKGTTASLTKTYPRKGDTRSIVHKWCNEVVKYYTNEAGFFGSKLTFTVKRKGGSAIYAMDFDGANAFSVSNNSSTNILPSWSPNGGQIAYTSFMRNNPDLYVSAAGGGRPKKISAQRGMNTGASWSPDGSKLAITLSKDGNPEIYIISASDGSIIKRLTDNKAIDTSPAWSPDGGSIAFVSDRFGGPQIFVVSAAGGTPSQVSKNGTYNTTPTWSPKAGKRIIAYTTRDGGTYDIVTLDLDSKAMVRVTQSEGQNEEPAFSPNGRAIAFARSGQGVFIANADGTGKAQKVWSGSATGVDWGPAPKD